MKAEFAIMICTVSTLMIFAIMSVLYLTKGQSISKSITMISAEIRDMFSQGFLRKKMLYLIFIFCINVIMGYLVFKYSSILGVYIAFISLKSKDVIMATVQLIHLVYNFIKVKILCLQPPKLLIINSNIVSIIPVYSEPNDQVKVTIESIIANNLENNTNLICIITDGAETNVDDNLTKLVGRFEYVYTSWKQQNNFLDVVFGFIDQTPCVIIHKKFNMGKKDSLIIAHDMFNYARSSLDAQNIQFRQDIRAQISNVYGVTDFHYMFCTDADTFIEKQSIYSLMETITRYDAIAACGLVVIDFAGKNWNFWNLFQNFQYLYGQYIRRGVENMYGKVSCLPGCITLFKIDPIASGAIEFYAKTPGKDKMLENIVQLLGTDRRLTSSFLYQNKKVLTKFDTNAKCFTIPPCELRPYLSQRRRWGSNAYFNTMCNLVAPNIHPFMRFFSSLDYIRMSLEYFRVFNTVIFIYKLIQVVHIMKMIPFIVVIAFPTTFFLLWALFVPFMRGMYFQLIIGYILNKFWSILISLMVLSNVFWNIGSVKWGGNQKDNISGDTQETKIFGALKILVNNPIYIEKTIDNPLYIEDNVQVICVQ